MVRMHLSLADLVVVVDVNPFDLETLAAFSTSMTSIAIEST